MINICDDRTDDHHVNKNSAGKNNSVGGRTWKVLSETLTLPSQAKEKLNG
jgi:hypothetical protein